MKKVPYYAAFLITLFATHTAYGCGTVTGLATSVTFSSFKAKWTPISGATSYTVEYEKYGSSTWTDTTVSADSLTISGLLSSTYYLVAVKASCSDSFSSYAYAHTSAPASCPVPTGLYANDSTGSSFVFHWSPVSGATSYTVEYESTSGGSWIDSTCTKDSLNITGLTAGTWYYISVKANCADSSSAFASHSYGHTTTAHSAGCPVPTGLYANDSTGSSFVFHWSPVSGATSYTVEYESSSGGSWIDSTCTKDSLNITGLTSGTWYYISVKANCADSSSAFASHSYGHTTTAHSAGCPVPTGLYANDSTGSSFVFHWSPVSGATSYTVEYESTSGGSWIDSTCTKDSLNITGLTAGKWYYISVKANCADSSSAFASHSYGHTTTAHSAGCPVPTGLYANDSTGSSFVFHWSPVSGATSYTVEYESTSGGSWIDSTCTKDSLNITGLTAGTWYYISVKANCPDSSSAFASHSYGHTKTGTTGCGIPADLHITAHTTSTMSFKWNTVSGATSYTFGYEKTGTTTWIDTTLTGDSIKLTGLPSGTSYNIDVRANCGDSSSAYSATIYGYTYSTGCGKVTGLTTSATSSSFSAKWTAISGATSYTVEYEKYGSTSWTDTTVAADSLTISGLLSSTYYVVAVKASCSDSFSSYAYAHTSAAAGCPVPTGLYANDSTGSSFVFHWTAVSGATSYTVEYKSTAGGSWIDSTCTRDSLKLTGLTSGTWYYISVKANCPDSSSAFASHSYGRTTTATSTSCGVAADLTITRTTASSFTAKWNAVSGATAYTVEYEKYGTTTWIDTNVTGDSLTISGLVASTYYFVAVKSHCAGDTSSAYSSTVYAHTSAATVASCAVPTHVTISKTTSNSFTVKWNAVSGATSYTVEYEKYGTTTWIDSTVSGDSLTVTGLVSATYYFVAVKAHCGSDSSSAYSTTVYAHTGAATTACSLPTDVNITHTTSSSFIVRWNPVSGATSYTVEYEKYGTSTWIDSTCSADSLAITGLVSSSYYAVAVKANCGTDSSSAYSSTVWGFTSSTSCSAPTGITITHVTATSITVKWSPATSALTYTVEYEKSGTSSWIDSNTSADSLVITGLTPSTYYIVAVETHCTSSISSSFSGTTYGHTLADSSCGLPTDLTMTNHTSTSFTVKWHPVSGATSYVVEYEKYGSSVWVDSITTADSIVVKGVAPSSYYYVAVKALCGTDSSSAFSSTVYAYTTSTASSGCALPTDLTVAATTSSTFKVKWNTVSGATGYTVEYEKYGTTTWVDTTITGDSLTVSGLLSSTYYFVAVKALCGSDSSSAFSSTVYAHTATGTTTACGLPTDVNISTTTSSSFKVKWNAVSGATSYTVEYEKYGTTTWIDSVVTTDSLVVSGLASSTYYYVSVKANCTGDSSSAFSASVYAHTSSTACAVVTGITSAHVKSSSFTVKWTPVSGATGYTVEYEKYGTTTWIDSNVTGDSLVVSGLASSTYYFFAVETHCDGGGSSSFSSSSYVHTAAADTCNTPTDLTITNTTSTAISIKWHVASGATSYTVEYQKYGTSAWTDTTLTADSLTFVGLSASTYYIFAVRSNCAGSETSSFTSYVYDETHAAPAGCPAPYYEYATHITDSSATIKWVDSSSTAFFYLLAWRHTGSLVWNYDTVSTDSFTLTGLAAGANFQYQVLALCTDTAISAYTATRDFSTSSLSGARTMGATAGVAAVTFSSNDVAVFPNPSQNEFNITYQLNTAQEVSISVMNYMGEAVETVTNKEQQSAGNYHYTVKPNAAGVYFVKMNVGGITITKKVIKL
jgi:hypothetical protein